MKKLLFFLFLLTTRDLFSEGSHLEIDAKLKYYQSLSFSKEPTSKLTFNKWDQELQGDIELEGQLGENFFSKISLTHQNTLLTCKGSYLKEAYAGVRFKGVFSFSAGCSRTHEFGWDQENFDLLSTIKSPLRESLYKNKYRRLLEANFHFFGTLSAQLMEDDLSSNNKDGLLASNFSWHKKIGFLEPLLQFSLFENYKSYSYTLGLKFNVSNLSVRFDAGQVRLQTAKHKTFFNLSPRYEFVGFFTSPHKDSLTLNFIGSVQSQKLSSETHLVYSLYFDESVQFFSDLMLMKLSGNTILALNLGLKASL